MAKDNTIHFENIVVHFDHDSRVLTKHEYNKLSKLLQKTLAPFKQLINSSAFKNGKKIAKKETIEIGLNLCGFKKIQKLNADYRQKNYVTDVLSFPVFDNLRDTSNDETAFPVLSLGDIIICSGQAKKQAAEHHIDYFSEVVHLFVHGLLHLVGYDHELSKSEEKLMEAKEQLLLSKL